MISLGARCFLLLAESNRKIWEKFGLSVALPICCSVPSCIILLLPSMADRSCYRQHHRRRRYALASLTSLVLAEGNHCAASGQRRTFRPGSSAAFAYNPSPFAQSSSRVAPAVRFSRSASALCSTSTSIPTPATHSTRAVSASAEIDALTKHKALWMSPNHCPRHGGNSSDGIGPCFSPPTTLTWPCSMSFVPSSAILA